MYLRTDPPREQQTVPFDCWAIHRFAHVTEEGDESGVFQSSVVASHNNSGATGTAESNPNVVTTTTTNTQESQSNNEPVPGEMPAELIPLMESNAPSINIDDADLVRHMVPGMIDDDNQPLPENIPTATEQQNNTPEFFSSWEHSGSCYRCLEGGRKNNARLSFNSEVQPSLEQLFEMFFQAVYCCNNHPPDKHSVGTTEESPNHLWRIPSLAWTLVCHGNNQWSRSV